MKLKKNNFQQPRLQELYQKEISHILYRLNKEKNLPSCTITFTELSPKGENLRIYLTFPHPEGEEILKIFNKDYLFLIKRQLINSKNFSRLPRIIFFLDKGLENLINLEKIVQKTEKVN